MDDHLPIGLFFSKYGQPGYVRVYKCDPNNRCETHVIFEEIGMVLNTYPEDNGDQGHHLVDLSERTNVFRISFFEAGLENYYASFSRSENEDLVPWTGYHQYSSR
jgi:hypothetical protein